MNKLYYVEIRLFDTFEQISTVIKKSVVASDKDEARNIISKMMDKELNEVNASCTGYEIIDCEVASIDYNSHFNVRR